MYEASGGYAGGFNVSDDGGVGRDAVGVLTPERSGTYFVEVEGGRGDTGSYTLALRTYADDRPDNESSRGMVELGGSVTGEIEEPGDKDWFAMELEAGVSYRVDMAGASSGGGTLVDPDMFGVYEASGGYAGGFNVSDDGGVGRDAVGVLTPERSGTYFVEVEGGRGDTGSYTLSLSEYEDDRIDDP